MADHYNVATLYKPCGKVSDNTEEWVKVALEYVDKTWRLRAYHIYIKGQIEFSSISDNLLMKPIFSTKRFTKKGMEKALEFFKKNVDDFVNEVFSRNLFHTVDKTPQV